jgi:hypothetical protein
MLRHPDPIQAKSLSPIPGTRSWASEYVGCTMLPAIVGVMILTFAGNGDATITRSVIVSTGRFAPPGATRSPSSDGFLPIASPSSSHRRSAVVSGKQPRNQKRRAFRRGSSLLAIEALGLD